MDVQHQTKLYVASLVEHGVRVLIYVRPLVLFLATARSRG